MTKLSEIAFFLTLAILTLFANEVIQDPAGTAVAMGLFTEQQLTSLSQ